jgi:hypothetical protein
MLIPVLGGYSVLRVRIIGSCLSCVKTELESSLIFGTGIEFFGFSLVYYSMELIRRNYPALG